jgi:hypothetical protein
MKGVETMKRAEKRSETMTIEEAKEALQVIRGIDDIETRIAALEDLLFSFEPDADGRKLQGPRADFYEALGQLYLFETTLHERKIPH